MAVYTSFATAARIRDLELVEAGPIATHRYPYVRAGVQQPAWMSSVAAAKWYPFSGYRMVREKNG